MMYTYTHRSFSFVVIILVAMHTWVVANPVILTSPLIQYVDGIFINGRRICDMRQLQLGVGFLAIGKKTREGTREPMYSFHLLQGDEDHFYVVCADASKYELYRLDHVTNRVSLIGTGEYKDLSSLPKIPEASLHLISFEAQKNSLIKNENFVIHSDKLVEFLTALPTARYSLHSLITLERHIADMPQTNDQYLYLPAMQSALDTMLGFMKRDFEKKSAKFIDDATLFKKAMIGLIQESCTARNREDSLLLTWAKSERGHEMQSFHQNVRSFKDFYAFSVDLINFLHDLMESCPKAKKQFKELMEQ